MRLRLLLAVFSLLAETSAYASWTPTPPRPCSNTEAGSIDRYNCCAGKLAQCNDNCEPLHGQEWSDCTDQCSRDFDSCLAYQRPQKQQQQKQQQQQQQQQIQQQQQQQQQ